MKLLIALFIVGCTAAIAGVILFIIHYSWFNDGTDFKISYQCFCKLYNKYEKHITIESAYVTIEVTDNFRKRNLYLGFKTIVDYAQYLLFYTGYKRHIGEAKFKKLIELIDEGENRE